MIKNGCGGGGARGPLLKGLARRLWKHHEPNILIHFIAVSQSKVFVCNNSHCCFLCAALFVVVRSFIIITIITIMIIMIMISRFSHSADTASPVIYIGDLMKPPDDFHPSPIHTIATTTDAIAHHSHTRPRHHPFGVRARLIKKKKKDMKRISYRKLRSASLLA